MKHSMDLTKKVCMCTFVSILLITLFVLSPLSNLFNNITNLEERENRYFSIVRKNRTK